MDEWMERKFVTLSVTRLGDFLKFWVIYFVSKVGQKYCDFRTFLKKRPITDKTCFGNILGIFWKNLGYF